MDSVQKISPETMAVLIDERAKQDKEAQLAKEPKPGKERSFRKLIEVAVLEKYK
jgi:hypothetical protein